MTLLSSAANYYRRMTSLFITLNYYNGMLSFQDYKQFRMLIKWLEKWTSSRCCNGNKNWGHEKLQLKVAEIASFHSSHYLDWYSLHEMVRTSVCCPTVLFLLLVPLRGCDCLIMCTATLLESRTSHTRFFPKNTSINMVPRTSYMSRDHLRGIPFSICGLSSLPLDFVLDSKPFLSNFYWPLRLPYTCWDIKKSHFIVLTDRGADFSEPSLCGTKSILDSECYLLSLHAHLTVSLVLSEYLDVHLSPTFQRKCNSHPPACKKSHQEHPLCVY